ncbi:putative type VI secretion system effector [Lonsdalea quercina]|uniref:putative type VI secretion system effector n=1 Tax=Lonsdalea quercina TaxID=71657 RepID=UPI00397543D1
MNSDEQKYINSRFIEPEKIKELRTKREIELIHGRSWMRELPPPPVLPPFGPLEKINGRLESFSREYFSEYFDVKAYRTSTLPSISDTQRGAAAGAAILAGSPGVGSVIMAESESANSSAEYVQGMINGKPFRGWVGITRLQVGDEVEMVVEWQHDHYEVYAIALPEERIVSICPMCEMGHIAHALWRIRNMFILTAILIFMITVSNTIRVILDDSIYSQQDWVDNIKFLLIMLGGSASISGLLAFSAYKACAPTCCKLAEEIFSTLGMKNVSRINLKKITKLKEKKLKNSGKWNEPSDKDKTPMPTRKLGYSSESWFYY